MPHYWHSSPVEIKGSYLKAHPSYVLDGESAVFGAKRRYISLAFLAKWSDDDLWFGYNGKQWLMRENRAGVFKHVFAGKSGWVYKVKGQFRSDPRLGLKGDEFVCQKAKIVGREFIPDVWAALQNTPIRLIPYRKRK